MLAPEIETDARLAAAQRDVARADLARFIAACYYEPGPEFAEERLFDSIAEAAARIAEPLAGLARRLGEAFAAARADELLIDYTRLFLGPVNTLARPYASVWLSGEPGAAMQDSTMEVLQMYAEGGFEIDESFRELPDHVAVELEFLYLLTWRDNEARWGGADAARHAAASELRQRFLEGHLGRWLGPFLLAMHEGAESEFYETLAELTEAFVRLEATRG